MKVGDLLNELKDLDPTVLVVMSRDEEGNGYSPLSGIESALYVAESTWSGYLTDDICYDDDDEEIPCDDDDDAVPAIVLYPVN